MGQATGFVVWLTGLPASGKSSLAHAMQEQLAEQHIKVLILDSDDLRPVMIPNPAYTKAERRWFYSVLIHLAVSLSQNGINVIVAATTNLRVYRDEARQKIGRRFAEVYVNCPVTICQFRDNKGLYKLARQNGDGDSLPGVGAPYERPFAPEAEANMDKLLPAEAATHVLVQLELQGIINPKSDAAPADPVSF